MISIFFWHGDHALRWTVACLKITSSLELHHVMAWVDERIHWWEDGRRLCFLCLLILKNFNIFSSGRRQYYPSSTPSCWRTSPCFTMFAIHFFVKTGGSQVPKSSKSRSENGGCSKADLLLYAVLPAAATPAVGGAAAPCFFLVKCIIWKNKTQKEPVNRCQLIIDLSVYWHSQHHQLIIWLSWKTPPTHGTRSMCLRIFPSSCGGHLWETQVQQPSPDQNSFHTLYKMYGIYLIGRPLMGKMKTYCAWAHLESAWINRPRSFNGSCLHFWDSLRVSSWWGPSFGRESPVGLAAGQELGLGAPDQNEFWSALAQRRVNNFEEPPACHWKKKKYAWQGLSPCCHWPPEPVKRRELEEAHLWKYERSRADPQENPHKVWPDETQQMRISVPIIFHEQSWTYWFHVILEHPWTSLNYATMIVRLWVKHEELHSIATVPLPSARRWSWSWWSWRASKILRRLPWRHLETLVIWNQENTTVGSVGSTFVENDQFLFWGELANLRKPNSS